jgi:glycosyltransferase involved in cell wall biosynthesis
VLFERRQGKGFVVQSMFRRVEADVYVMVDGDATYPAEAVRSLVEPIRRGEADMVVGSRLHDGSSSKFRLLNRLGNRLFLFLLNWIFGVRLSDLLSGYRAFSRRLVRALPLLGGGFETETELTIKALQRGFGIMEVPVDLGQRPSGSFSKIRIVQDGWIILSTLLTLVRDYRSLRFFGSLGLLLIGLSLLPAAWVLSEFGETGTVHRLPSAVLATGLVLSGVLSITVGLVLHTIARHFQELDLRLQLLADDLRREGVGGRRPWAS